ncbi:glutathione hydrolase 1 proenzyme-like isoform X1 [Scyliorhinus canicula]|uniref:glutathione hydrolase 1 proenzyme-like isoform X1 n=2 Tax=Scyliorhinus canicula TaxID=7830 RepID=UPI0018F791F8|nr:glutathione hydrolase 1 proenzyme-like isoform X1 [Scyliorhinus canicula]XP_038649699.1 glutathione hydrolase 1 proenzyme-like isoform X1 [Scyliorhinus canicula]
MSESWQQGRSLTNHNAEQAELPQKQGIMSENNRKMNKTSKGHITFVVMILEILVFCLSLHFGLKPKETPPYSFERAVVAADAERCSEIGRDILKQNGSAVDAAIATMLCNGLMNVHSMGIGGGFIMIIYNAQTGKTEIIFSREVAPGNASWDMFINKTDGLARKGGLSIAVPGEVRGYQLAHQRHGRLPWKHLFEPSIKLAKEGFPISRAVAEAMKRYQKSIEEKQSLCEILCNSDGEILQENDTIRFPKLAETYRILADEGADAFYNGSLSLQIVNDIKNAGGIITLEDLRNYRPQLSEDVIKMSIGDYTLLLPSAPSSGPVLALILNILKGYNFTPDSVSSPEAKALTYHRAVEAFKFAYAKQSMMGDPLFVNMTELIANMTASHFAAELWAKITDETTHSIQYYEPDFYPIDNHGTAHVSLVAEDGSAVSVTSSINFYFGSHVRSSKNGIIFNNQMNDFAWPGKGAKVNVSPSTTNFIKPGKTPLSSMCPAIILDKNKSVKMVVGASGGVKITTTNAWVIMNVLWFNYNIKRAVTEPRVHHQLFPNVTHVEEAVEKAILEGLQERHHILETLTRLPRGGVVQAIVRDEGKWFAESDYRKGGKPAGY